MLLDIETIVAGRVWIARRILVDLSMPRWGRGCY